MSGGQEAQDGTGYHPSEHAAGKGQIAAAWLLVLTAATLALGMPLLGSGIGGPEHRVAASPALNPDAHLGWGAVVDPSHRGRMIGPGINSSRGGSV